jgi:uncharacterized protein YqgC (DUF456 family)
MLEVATWCLSLTLMVVGFVGVIVPILPGTTLILVAALLHKWLLPSDLSWMAIGFIALFWFLSVLADFGGVLLGTRWFGGSKWGMAGASGGALVGIFFSIPILILGTMLGAVVAEKLVEKKTSGAAIKSGVGAAVGFVISTVARAACAAVMIALFLMSALTLRTLPAAP